MGSMLISGQTFPDRPCDSQWMLSPLKRYTYIRDALDFAASACSEVDRALYKTIREVQAHAMNLQARAMADSPKAVQAELHEVGESSRFD